MKFRLDKNNTIAIFKSLERGAKIQMPLNDFVQFRNYLEFQQNEKLIYVCNEYFCRIEHTKPNENELSKIASKAQRN
jgi:hypothetical protein